MSRCNQTPASLKTGQITKAGRFLLACGFLFLLTACFSKRTAYDVPAVPLATKFKNELTEKPPKDSTNATVETKINQVSADGGQSFADWWRYLGNDELEGLINRGIANNPDIRIATIRLAQAKTRAEQAEAGQKPALSLPFTVARQTSAAAVGSVPVDSSVRAPQTSLQTSLRGDFRVDVWGEQAALVESAQLQLRRAALERDNVQRNVVSTIAMSYVELLALNDRLKIAKETERILSDTLSTMQRRLEMGDATVGEMEQQKASIFGLRAAIPLMEQQREDALNSLAFLVGTLPGALKLSVQGLDSLSIPEVVPGLPSSLLLRRPDIRMVEARLLAAEADIDVARARILPPLDLAAQAGYSSNLLAQLLLPKALFWNAVASVTASVFDAGKRENEKKFNESVYEEMVETYIRTIYQAMREVENSLATIRLVARRLDSQRQAAEAARRAWQINTKVYAMGGLDHLSLLESERNFHRYQDEYQRAQGDHFKGYVSLFNAIGGGVKTAPVLPGKGKRPQVELTGSVGSSFPTAVGKEAFSTEGVEVPMSGTAGFWILELPGLYHRSAVGPAWRDLLKRYPDSMKNRMIRPRLSGQTNSEPESDAWYRLSIAKFASEAEASEFCERLRDGLERCNVNYSVPGERPLPSTKASTDSLAAQVPEEAENKTRLPTGSAESPSSPSKIYAIQLGVFKNPENAAVASEVWQHRGYSVDVIESRQGNETWYLVRQGSYSDKVLAEEALKDLSKREDLAAMIVPVSGDSEAVMQTASLEKLLKERQLQNSPVLPEPPEASSYPEATAKVVLTRSAGGAGKFSNSKFSIQLGAFSVSENARLALDYWQSRGLSVHLSLIRDAERQPLYAVRSGEFFQRRKAQALAVQLGRKEGVSAVVVPFLPENQLAAEEPSDQRKAIAVAQDSPVVESVPSLVVNKMSSGPRFSIQLGAFSLIENAATAFAEWQARGYEPYVCETDDVRGNLRFALRTGEYASKAQAQQMIRLIQRQEGLRAVLVPVLLNDQGALKVIDVRPLLPELTVDSIISQPPSDSMQ